MAFPGHTSAREHLDEVAAPALEDVAAELRGEGVEAQARRATDDTGQGCVELTADLRCEHPFTYRICLRAVPIPGYGRRAGAGEETYSRLEVHLGEGGQGYDVMGYTYSQLIDDVLDQYERHLEFLRLQEPIPAPRQPDPPQPVPN
jgi:choline/glycine/proline betaine transport protein